jgi:cation transport regulator ChaB
MCNGKNHLPKTLRRHAPEELQEIYLEAYQNFWREYKKIRRGGEAGRDAVAHRDAMVAVRRDHLYHQQAGTWYRKGEEPQEEEERDVFDSLEEMIAGS